MRITHFLLPLFVACAAQAGTVQAADQRMPHTAKVIDNIDAGIYTYVEIPRGPARTWLAAPTFAVKNGDTIGYDNGPVITGYYSKSLNRTFDAVMFVNRAAVVEHAREAQQKQEAWPNPD